MARLIIIIALAMTAFSCGNQNNRRAEQTIAGKQDSVSQSDDYTGTYKGTLPCADCEGIEVTLRLKKDGEYVLKTKHVIDKHGMDDIHIEYDGAYGWDETERIVTLHNITTQPNKYLYEDGSLRQLDMNGNRISGPLAERYVLKK